MLKPAEMRELRIITLDEHLDGVIKRIDALGSVHLTDIEEFSNVWQDLIEPSLTGDELLKSSELLMRINNLIALLQPQAEVKKSLKELLFKEQVEEKVAKAEGLELEQIEPEFAKLEKRVNELISKNERLKSELSNTNELLGVLRILDDFGVDLDFIGEKDFTVTYAGKLPLAHLEELEGALKSVVGENQFAVSKLITEGEEEVAFALIVALKDDKEVVERALMRLEFEFWQRPRIELPERIKDAIAEVERSQKRRDGDIKETEREVAEIRNTKLSELLAMQEFMQIEDNKAKVKVLFGHSECVRVIEGWTPKEEVDTVKAGIREETGGYSVVEEIEPKRDDARVPSLLKNPGFLKPFESIIKMYGHPLYNDIDPTVITAIIFPLLFGLMFPDMAHGLIILLLGLALMFAFKGLEEEIRGMGIIIALCGLCSVVAGALFGEFFGFSNEAAHLVHESVPGMSAPVPFQALWFEPLALEVNTPFGSFSGVQCMFIISMLIGGLHMGLGLTLNMANNLSRRDIFGSISSLFKIWCLFGALYFLLLLFGFYFVELKEGNSPVLVRNMVIFLLFPILLLFILKIIAELRHEEEEGAHSDTNGGKKEKRGIMDYLIILIDGVIDALLENFFRFLANIVSYGRILALALCHAALIEVFILLAFMCLAINPVIGPVLAAVVFLVGTVIVIILEAIMAGIHTIRLHFYEWFTKFYEGGGVEFTPFKLRRTYEH